MTSENVYRESKGRKLVIYRAVLPAHPGEWTLDTLRQFVRDAELQGISGDTHVKRTPESQDFGFVHYDNPYYGLCLERTVDLGEL